MIYPAPIKPGDTIGLVAPSFGAVIEPYATRLKSAIERFEARGYHVRTAPSVYKSDGLGISTNPADAAADVMKFYLDDSIDALISVGGGELMNETISHIDFKRLGEAEPKWFLGYSDNTRFIFPMACGQGIAGIYGPCATGFGKEWEKSELDAFSILEGTKRVFSGYSRCERPDDDTRTEDPLAPYQITAETKLLSFIPEHGKLVPYEGTDVRFSGILMGGCLDVLANLAGTPYDNAKNFSSSCDEKIVWVLEACDLNPMSIRRSLWCLKHNGWFESAGGFVIGRPLAAWGAEMMGVDQYNAVTDVLGELQVPVIMDAPVGHIPPMMPLIIGAYADVSAENCLTVSYLS